MLHAVVLQSYGMIHLPRPPRTSKIFNFVLSCRRLARQGENCCFPRVKQVWQELINYNVPLINSIVLYVGMQKSSKFSCIDIPWMVQFQVLQLFAAIQQLQSRSNQSGSAQPMTQNPHMDIMLVGAAMDIFLELKKKFRHFCISVSMRTFQNNHSEELTGNSKQILPKLSSNSTKENSLDSVPYQNDDSNALEAG